MSYPLIGEHAWIDLEQLKNNVNQNYFEELVEFPVFQKMLLSDPEMAQKWKEMDNTLTADLEKLGDCPEGTPLDATVLDFQHDQGVLVANWKKAKVELAQNWCEINR